MSNICLSPADAIGERNPLHIIPVWRRRAGGSQQIRTPAARCKHSMSRSSLAFLWQWISKLDGQVNGLGTVHPPFTLSLCGTWSGVVT